MIWKKCLGGSAKDAANHILLNSDGSIIAVGYSHSNDGDVTGHHGDATTSDGWVTKLGPAGNLLWQKSLGGTANDYLKTVIATDDGGYLCTGYTYSDDGDVTGNHGMADVWAVKLNSSGTLIWSKCYGGTQMDTAVDAVQLHDGQFALTGSTKSFDGDVLSGSANNPAFDAWVIKLNKANGNLIWERVINYGDSSLDDGGINIVESNNNTIMAYISVAYTTRYWSWDQWNYRTDYGGSVYEINEATGTATYFSSAGGGLQKQMIMCKSNTGYNFAYDASSYTASPINCYSYSRIVLQQDFAGNLIKKIVVNQGTCDDSHPGRPVSIISQSHGFIISSTGKFITTGQAEVPDQWIFNYYIKKGYISNMGVIGTGDGYDRINAVLELAVGDEFIAAGFTGSGKLSDTSAAATDFHGDADFWILKYQSLNRIQGNFYIDYNNNNIKDAGEPPFKRAVAKTVNQAGTESSWGYPVNGISEVTVGVGTFKTAASLFRPYYTISPDTTTSIFTTYKNTVTIDYPVHPVLGSRDYTVYITPTSVIRPGFDVSYRITYSNAAIDTLINKQVKFVKDPHLQFVSSAPPQTGITGDTITWNIASLVPDSTGYITVHLQADAIPALQLDDIVTVSASIDSTGDLVKQNNMASSVQRVTGSYDPNDKQENSGGNLYMADAAAGKYLTYTIRFQNTGNDTAFNINVRDTLSAFLDSTSFEMISASHAYKVIIKDGKYIVWQFNDIKLLDSIHNEPLSHGYISYRIKPKLPVGIGDEIKNRAAIYFDYNPPVITNTSITTIKGTPGNASWTGAVSTAWENPQNWSNGLLPDVNTIVIIPAGVPNYPEVSSNAACYRITVMPSATVLIKTGFKLQVNAKN